MAKIRPKCDIFVDAHEKWPEFEHRKLPKNEHFGGRGVVMRPVAG